MYINSVILAFCHPLGGSIFHLTLDREIIKGVSRCIVTKELSKNEIQPKQHQQYLNHSIENVMLCH